MKIEPVELIKKYYDVDSKAYEVLMIHSQMVKKKALELAARIPHLNPDLQFIAEGAILHDIGIFLTDAPSLGCFGEHDYMVHGILGRELLDKEGLPRHALVCERHTGVGLSRADIRRQGLPLPDRDMLPISIEEKVICFADTFYGKNPKKLRKEKTIEKIEEQMAKWGEGSRQRTADFRKLFSI